MRKNSKSFNMVSESLAFFWERILQYLPRWILPHSCTVSVSTFSGASAEPTFSAGSSLIVADRCSLAVHFVFPWSCPCFLTGEGHLVFRWSCFSPRIFSSDPFLFHLFDLGVLLLFHWCFAGSFFCWLVLILLLADRSRRKTETLVSFIARFEKRLSFIGYLFIIYCRETVTSYLFCEKKIDLAINIVFVETAGGFFRLLAASFIISGFWFCCVHPLSVHRL